MRMILVVEDDQSFRELLSDILREAGYEVLTARDGLEGWRLVEKMRPDLAILDLNMPHLDGWGLTRRIRGDKRFQEMPILMLTIRHLVEDQVSGYKRGADDYLTKPFDHAMLLARVRVLERRILDKATPSE